MKEEKNAKNSSADVETTQPDKNAFCDMAVVDKIENTLSLLKDVLMEAKNVLGAIKDMRKGNGGKDGDEDNSDTTEIPPRIDGDNDFSDMIE